MAGRELDPAHIMGGREVDPVQESAHIMGGILLV